MTDRRIAGTGALKLLRLAAILLVVSALCFFGLNLVPGDPARLMLGPAGSPQDVAALRGQMGLDRPALTRFLAWLGSALHGDLGRSYVNHVPVSDTIRQRAPVTLELIFFSQFIALVVAIPAAIVAAVKRRSVADRTISLWVFGMLAVPHFVLAYLLIWVFAITLGILPANGYIPMNEGIEQHLSSLVLPSLALAAAPFALYQRVFRADLVETYQHEFMAVARAKGITPRRAALRHATRPSLLGLTTSVGVTVGTLMSAAVVVEVIFSLPGLGAALVDAVSARDYITVQGLVLVFTVAFVLINAFTDLLYPLIDPRLRVKRDAVGAGR